jgi:hypothetical protein
MIQDVRIKSDATAEESCCEGTMEEEVRPWTELRKTTFQLKIGLCCGTSFYRNVRLIIRGQGIEQTGRIDMRGALVFLAVFAVVTLISIASPNIPPGLQIYQALNVPLTDYPVGGIPASTLIIAIFNGVVYGVIAWILYSIADRAMKKDKTEATTKTQ